MADNSSFSGDPALLNQASDLMDFVFNTFFQSFSLDSDIERLTVHANQMNQLLPPVKSSMVTYVIQDVSESVFVCVCVCVCVCVMNKPCDGDRERCERES